MDERKIGMMTPVLAAELAAFEDTVPAVIAAGVETIVLPALSMVVIGLGDDAATVLETATLLTRVLPAEFVVVIAIEPGGTLEPTIVLASLVKYVIPWAFVVVTGTMIGVGGGSFMVVAWLDTTMLPSFVEVIAIVVGMSTAVDC